MNTRGPPDPNTTFSPPPATASMPLTPWVPSTTTNYNDTDVKKPKAFSVFLDVGILICGENTVVHTGVDEQPTDLQRRDWDKRVADGARRKTLFCPVRTFDDFWTFDKSPARGGASNLSFFGPRLAAAPPPPIPHVLGGAGISDTSPITPN